MPGASSPGDEKEFDVVYPEDYGGRDKLALAKTIRFQTVLKGLRRKANQAGSG